MAIIRQYLGENFAGRGLAPEDIDDLEITSSHTSRQSGVTHVYVRQRHRGLPVANGVANFALRNGEVIHAGDRLLYDLASKASSATPAITPAEGLTITARYLGLGAPREWPLSRTESPTAFWFAPSGIAQEDIPVRLMYYAVAPDDVRLVWDITLRTSDGEHWWSVKADAQRGEIVAQQDLIVHCRFDASPFSRAHKDPSCLAKTASVHSGLTSTGTGQYLVVPLPSESPNHGAPGIVADPSDPVASPYGWHDVDGLVGPEYTTTQGNNVHAYEDQDNDDLPGFSPDGGADLVFTFPYDPLNDPVSYQSAAITNLFYLNNMMHDIWYPYGFDEVSGNFQANNYNLGGIEGDYVLAEAQDGGGLNNANFGTPPDGSQPRMQMYLWENTTPGSFLVVHAPDSIAGPYLASAATFGPPLPAVPVTADLVLMEDQEAPVNDGCGTLTNGDQLSGRIALVDRGNCTFAQKVQAAQDAGAVAVIVVNNISGPPTQMGGVSGTITIPSIMVSLANGELIKASLAFGSVNASISDGGGTTTRTLDGDFDNGVIAHEYGHGISTRLVGGADNVSCLFNAEQMGEGWSDWFALMLTQEPGDRGEDIRGIGTFAVDQPVDGRGIRPAPYSTDFAVNAYTYAASNNTSMISQPHGVGFIWATMLWDLNWALIDAYGGAPDPDLQTGTGGNNIAMQLVIEALKLTPCGPGMVDGRDAILLADRVLYDGAHECLIWEVFARRGLGFSAEQGSPDSRTDQVEAFDLPTSCQVATLPPIAAFAVDTVIECTRTVSFTDESTNIPQVWAWDFGDGSASAERNPVHTYPRGGSYSVRLVVINTVGQDTLTRRIDIVLPPAPVAADQEACIGESLVLTAEATGRVVWRDTTRAILHVGDTLLIDSILEDRFFILENEVGEPAQFAGPVDASFGPGGYHGSGYFGATNFTAEQGFTMVSAWVDSPIAGPRTFILGRGTNIDGVAPAGTDIVDQVTVDVPAGQQRIPLGLKVPEAGDYCIGAALSQGTRLYRNNAGSLYPYPLSGLLTLTSSSANTNPLGYYYYLYDLEVRAGDLCVSDPDTVRVSAVRSAFAFVESGSLTLSFQDASVGAWSWRWDFGDGSTSTEQNPVHTYAQGGEYAISLSVNDGICSSVQTYTGLVSGVGGQHRPVTIVLEPNPANSMATLRLSQSMAEDLVVTVMGLDGVILSAAKLPAGRTTIPVDVSGWPSAVYVVQVTGRSFGAVQKLVVE